MDNDVTTEKYKREFLRKYGGHGFTEVKFRPGARMSTPFGLDNTFVNLRIHTGVDRGKLGSLPTDNPIYCPFDAVVEWLPDYSPGSFGSLLRLCVNEFRFEIRIGHIENCLVLSGHQAKAGELLAYAGNKGKSTDTHTHSEVVSYDETCPVLDKVLIEKFGRIEVMANDYSMMEVSSYIERNHVDEIDDVEAYERELNKKGITFLNQYQAKRRDYYTGKAVTFYSSYELFGM